jgi:hypothetical protein
MIDRELELSFIRVRIEQDHRQMFLFLFLVFNRLIHSIPALLKSARLSHN